LLFVAIKGKLGFTGKTKMKTYTLNKIRKVQISQQWLAIAGIVAPILYISVAIIMGLLEPGYRHKTMMMSILGGVGGWRGAAFNLELVLTGTLLIAFGWVSQKFSQRQSVITFASFPLNYSFLFQQPQFPVGVYRTNCSIVWAR
jgi:hypothetical membrane protein